MRANPYKSPAPARETSSPIGTWLRGEPATDRELYPFLTSMGGLLVTVSVVGLVTAVPLLWQLLPLVGWRGDAVPLALGSVLAITSTAGGIALLLAAFRIARGSLSAKRVARYFAWGMFLWGTAAALLSAAYPEVLEAHGRLIQIGYFVIVFSLSLIALPGLLTRLPATSGRVTDGDEASARE